MKKLRILYIVTAIILCGGVISSQTADDVIVKYLTAIGGSETFGKITSLYTESKISVMGFEAVQKTTILNGKGYRTDMDFNGSLITTCVTDKGGWSVNPMSGSSTPEDMTELQYNRSKDQIYIGAPFTIYKDKGYKAELAGNDMIGTANTIKVKLIAPDKTTTTYWFDSETGYILKSVTPGEMQGQEVEFETTYSDYRPVNGLQIPFKVTTNMGGMVEMTGEVIKAEVNKPVDAGFFAKK